jgi:integrase
MSSARKLAHVGKPGSKFNATEVKGVWFNCDERGNATVYGIRFYDELHKRRTVAVGRDYEHAKVKLAEVTVAHAKGEATSNVNITLKQVVEEWRGVRVYKKQSTVEGYDFVIDKHVLPYLGTLKVKSITVPTIVKWVDRLQKNGLSGSYCICIFGKLSIILSHAVAQGYATGNVCKQVPTRLRPKSDTEERRMISAGEEAAIYLRIAGSRLRGWLADYITIALAQALRIGEVCGLQWDDFNWEARTLTVARQVKANGRYLEADGSYILPKNGERETIALTQPTYDLLHPRYLAWKIAGSDNPWVFTDASGGPRKSGVVEHAFNSVRGSDDISFHSLRHTCASRLVNSGLVRIDLASRFLRHSDIKITQEYLHADPTQADDELAALDAALVA